MKYALAILIVLALCSLSQAQCVGPGCTNVYYPPPYTVQPPEYMVQPAPVIVQPAVPVIPYTYRQQYWTPVRDFLFGRYRTGFAYYGGYYR